MGTVFTNSRLKQQRINVLERYVALFSRVGLVDRSRQISPKAAKSATVDWVMASIFWNMQDIYSFYSSTT